MVYRWLLVIPIICSTFVFSSLFVVHHPDLFNFYQKISNSIRKELYPLISRTIKHKEYLCLKSFHSMTFTSIETAEEFVETVRDIKEDIKATFKGALIARLEKLTINVHPLKLQLNVIPCSIKGNKMWFLLESSFNGKYFILTRDKNVVEIEDDEELLSDLVGAISTDGKLNSVRGGVERRFVTFAPQQNNIILETLGLVENSRASAVDEKTRKELEKEFWRQRTTKTGFDICDADNLTKHRVCALGYATRRFSETPAVPNLQYQNFTILNDEFPCVREALVMQQAMNHFLKPILSNNFLQCTIRAENASRTFYAKGHMTALESIYVFEEYVGKMNKSVVLGLQLLMRLDKVTAISDYLKFIREENEGENPE